MAERYQVRGRRIWDSETDTYSGLFGNVDNAEWIIKHRDVSKFPFKPLAEWQDDKQESDPVEEPRYKAVGRRILDTKTDTWSKAWHDETMAAVIANWCNAANGGDVQARSVHRRAVHDPARRHCAGLGHCDDLWQGNDLPASSYGSPQQGDPQPGCLPGQHRHHALHDQST